MIYHIWDASCERAHYDKSHKIEETMSQKPISVRFYGVRGSIPAPNDSTSLQRKLKEVLQLAQNQDLNTEDEVENFIQNLPFHLKNNIKKEQ